MSHYPLSNPFRSLLSTVTSYIFGHVPSEECPGSTRKRKRGKDDCEETKRIVTPSPARGKRRRRRYKAKKMVLSESDSCNTLVDLAGLAKEQRIEEDGSCRHRGTLGRRASIEDADDASARFRETRILLPADDYDFTDEDDAEQDAAYCQQAATASSAPSRLYLPKASSEDQTIDRYLSTLPPLVEAADSLLSVPPVHLSSQNCRGVRVLNVLQGEIGHCTADQADVIVSDKATTCHILALRSTSVGDGGRDEACAVSLAHIDRAGYEKDLMEAVRAHKAYHRRRCRGRLSFANDGDEEKKAEDQDEPEGSTQLRMDVHIAGGFSDPDGSSSAITSSLLSTLAAMADEEDDAGAVFTLRTCAVGRLNDDDMHGGPVGRGLAVNVATGEVYLAKVDRSVAGPMIAARSARLWSHMHSQEERTLSVVHRLPSPTSSSPSRLSVEAFRYAPFPEISPILRLSDDVLLKYTSTSPDVEEDTFCRDVRSTLRFIRDTKAEEYFGAECTEDVCWRRRKDDVNRWELAAIRA